MVERAWSIAGRQQLGNQQRKIRRKRREREECLRARSRPDSRRERPEALPRRRAGHGRGRGVSLVPSLAAVTSRAVVAPSKLACARVTAVRLPLREEA